MTPSASTTVVMAEIRETTTTTTAATATTITRKITPTVMVVSDTTKIYIFMCMNASKNINNGQSLQLAVNPAEPYSLLPPFFPPSEPPLIIYHRLSIFFQDIICMHIHTYIIIYLIVCTKDRLNGRITT